MKVVCYIRAEFGGRRRDTGELNDTVNIRCVTHFKLHIAVFFHTSGEMCVHPVSFNQIF